MELAPEQLPSGLMEAPLQVLMCLPPITPDDKAGFVMRGESHPLSLIQAHDPKNLLLTTS